MTAVVSIHGNSHKPLCRGYRGHLREAGVRRGRELYLRTGYVTAFLALEVQDEVQRCALERGRTFPLGKAHPRQTQQGVTFWFCY